VRRTGREGVGADMKTDRYVRRLTDEYTATYIRCLTRLSSSIDTFLGAGTEEYNSVIFLSTDEYNVTEECTIFSCSVCLKVSRWQIGDQVLLASLKM
jgi:hypothetical protein